MDQDLRYMHLRRHVRTTCPVKICEIKGHKVTWCRYEEAVKAQSISLGPKDRPAMGSHWRNLTGLKRDQLKFSKTLIQ